MNAIDLVPVEAHTRRETGRRLRVWGRRVGSVALGAALIYGVLVRHAASGNAELVRLSGKYTVLQERLQVAESLIQERERLAQHGEAIRAIRKGRTVSRYLDALGETLTGDSHLSFLLLDFCAYSDPKRWGIPGGGDGCTPSMTLRGYAPGHKQVGRIIRGMFTSGEFGDVALVSVKERKDKAARGDVEFELYCTLAGVDRDD